MKKLTPWFDGAKKPKRKGVYQRTRSSYSYWNGEYWAYSALTADRAVSMIGVRSYHQDHPWRGLAEKP